MNFSKLIQRKSKLLLPFSWLYKMGAAIHMKMYDWGFKKSRSFELPVICIGNLSVGGTGKTPMVEYLLKLLSPAYKVAAVSRGYKRESSGVLIADENTVASQIGDEPMQFHTKFPEVTVVVGEQRVEAIETLLDKIPATDIIILDDAFQHRAVQAGFNILLTDYQNLFTQDYYLPAGQLRDLRSNYKRADAIVVTKCPSELSTSEKDRIIREIDPLPSQHIYFTTIRYGAPYHIYNGSKISLESCEKLLLVTGIADPKPLADHLKRHDISLKIISFPDHHNFRNTDIETIKQTFQTINLQNRIVITTEKDATRLQKFRNELSSMPVFAIPVEHHFLFSEGGMFDDEILRYIKNKK